MSIPPSVSMVPALIFRQLRPSSYAKYPRRRHRREYNKLLFTGPWSNNLSYQYKTLRRSRFLKSRILGRFAFSLVLKRPWSLRNEKIGDLWIFLRVYIGSAILVICYRVTCYLRKKIHKMASTWKTKFFTLFFYIFES